MKRAATQRGQALIELAAVIPALAVVIFGCLQFAIVIGAFVSMVNVTRDAARWIAVHPHTLDVDAVTQFNGRLPANMTAANTSFTISPACTSLTNGRCPGRNPGNQLSVTVTYNVAGLIFLPTRFGFGNLVIDIPTTLPAYTIFIQAEPA